MTSGQKISLSLLFSVILFSVFAVVAFSGLFNVVETHFYQPAVVDGIKKQLSSISDSFIQYTDVYGARFSAYTELACVKESAEPVLSQKTIADRTDATGLLLSNMPSLLGIRLLDSNGKRIHFSTFKSDILKENKTAVAYRNYNQLDEIEANQLLNNKKLENGKSILFDADKSRLIFICPFMDGYGADRGIAVFYVDSADFNRFLLAKNIISINDSGVLIGKTVTDEQNEAKSVYGFVFGLPNVSSDEIIAAVADKWLAGSLGTELVLKSDENTLVVLSDDSCGFAYFARVENEKIFDFPETVRILLLVCVFMTLFLGIYLLFSLKQDDMVIIRERIKRFQFSLIREYLENRDKPDWEKISEEITGRKNDVSLEVKRSLGRRGKRHSAEVDKLLEQSWNDILAALGKPKDSADADSRPRIGAAEAVLSAEGTAEIKRMLEQLIADGGSVQKKKTPQPVKAAQPVQTAVKKSPAVVEEAEPIEELGDVEEAEPIEELGAVEAAEPIEELGEVEAAEPIEELGEVEAAEPIEELGEVEEAEPIEELSDVEEAEPIEELGDVEEAEPIEELGDVEEAEPIEELSDVEAEPIEELSDVEAEPIEELADVEEAEPIEELGDVEEAEPIEELGEVEEAEPIEELGEVEEAEPIEELGEVDEAEPIEELSDVEEAEPIEELSDVEEAVPIEELGDIKEAEPIEELSDVEAEPIEELGDVEEAEPIKEILPSSPKVNPVTAENTDGSDKADEAAEAELIPLEEKGVNFSFTLSRTKLFGDKMDSNVITELKKVSNEAITEKDGIYMISENLDTRNVKLNDEFKGLVDSLL